MNTYINPFTGKQYNVGGHTMKDIPKSITEIIVAPVICHNCMGKKKVIVRVHNTDKLIECPVCHGQGQVDYTEEN